MIFELKQSTAVTISVGPFLDRTNGADRETALTIADTDVLLRKPGGSYAAKNDTTDPVHQTRGYYSCVLDATDTNTLGDTRLDVENANSLPVSHTLRVITADEWNRKYLGTGANPTLGILAQGTAQAATSTTIQLASGETFADDTLIGATVVAIGSTQGYAQTRTITDYVSSTDTATVDAWTVTPSGTISYVVFAGPPASTTSFPGVNVEQINGVNLVGDGDATPWGPA